MKFYFNSLKGKFFTIFSVLRNILFERSRDDGILHGGVQDAAEPALHVPLRRMEQVDPHRLASLLYHCHPQLLHHQKDCPVEPVSIKDHIKVSIHYYSQN